MLGVTTSMHNQDPQFAQKTTTELQYVDLVKRITVCVVAYIQFHPYYLQNDSNAGELKRWTANEALVSFSSSLNQLW